MHFFLSSEFHSKKSTKFVQLYEMAGQIVQTVVLLVTLCMTIWCSAESLPAESAEASESKSMWKPEVSHEKIPIPHEENPDLAESLLKPVQEEELPGIEEDMLHPTPHTTRLPDQGPVATVGGRKPVSISLIITGSAGGGTESVFKLS